MVFELVTGLAKKDFIINLNLCVVLLENNKFFPWVFLVPQKNNLKNMTYLTMDDRLQLMREMALVEKVMSQNFPHTQTNVAMIGNKTPQLHVHIICRTEGDADWPGTVWDGHAEKYSDEEKKATILKIKSAIEQELSNSDYNQLV